MKIAIRCLVTGGASAAAQLYTGVGHCGQFGHSAGQLS